KLIFDLFPSGEPPVKRKRGRPKTISNDSDDEWFSGPSSSASRSLQTALPVTFVVEPGSVDQKTLAELLGIPASLSSSSSSPMDLNSPSAIAAALSAINQARNSNIQISEPPGDLTAGAGGVGVNNNNSGNRLQVGGLVSVFGELATAFNATVARDYEKAAKIVRDVVKSDHAFGADELELIDHVFACVLNTAHYDETMIEVCWEWIHCLEREPRSVDARAIASSQLSVYYAYHTRMPRRADFVETRTTTWNKANESFRYFWRVACAVWRPFELDRIDVLVNWTYLALQFADAVSDEEIRVIETQTASTRAILGKSIVVEHAHQTNERFATVERNLKEIANARIEKRRRASTVSLSRRSERREVVRNGEREREIHMHLSRITSALKVTPPAAAAAAAPSTPAAAAPTAATAAKKTLAGAIDSLISRQQEAQARVKQEVLDLDE
ncbi:hypothetical protein PENTCL1PPCAC_24662, partial [Pristionchus entomophagus]